MDQEVDPVNQVEILLSAPTRSSQRRLSAKAARNVAVPEAARSVVTAPEEDKVEQMRRPDIGIPLCHTLKFILTALGMLVG